MKSFLVFVLFICIAVSSFAQVSRVAGSLEGIVTDTISATVASANVTVVNFDTGQSRTATTDDQGHFRFPELSVGSYELRIAHPGFAEYVHPNITVAIGQSVHLAVTLHPMGATENVIVTDTPPVLDTAQTTVTTNVDTERIEELPVQSRNYLNFVLLAPGVAPSAQQRPQSTSRSTVTTDSGFSFGGLRGGSNSISIDGLDNNDEYSGASRTELSLEIIREFQVVNNGPSAEFGGASGGAINVVTKIGANTLHGDAFVFLQNGALDARNPITDGDSSPDLNRYRVGFAIGGPISKNRTFYYTAFEQEHSRGTELPDIADAQTINEVLPSPILTTSRFPATRAETEVSGKLTHQLTARHSLMLRYAFTNNREAGDAFNNSSLYDYSAHGSSFVKDHAGVGSLTSTLSPSLLNDLRFQLAARQVVNRTTGQSGPGVEIAGVAIFGRPYAGNGSRNENHYELSDTLSLVSGSHLLKVGGTVNHVSLDASISDGFAGQYVFASLSEFLAGIPREYRQTFGIPQTNFGVTAIGGFLQDTWTPTRHLTLTIGSRYDFERLPSVFHQDTNNFSPRIGAVYSLSSQWLVRAGYGIFFDRFLLASLDRVLQRDGAQAFEQVLFDSAAQSVWSLPGQILPAPLRGTPPSIYRAQPGLATPYSQQVNFGIEHQLGENASLSATYLFVRGLKLPRTININLAPPQLLTTSNAAALGFAAPTAQQFGREVFGPARLNPAYDAIYESQNESSSTYHGLSLTLNRRLANEIAFSASYTFPKALDDGSNFDEQPQNPYSLHAERSFSANDQRHRFVFSGLFDLPIGDEKDRQPGSTDNVFTTVFRNIEVAPIFSASAGYPITALVGFDALHSLAYPATARPAGFARNSLRTSSTVNLDLRLVKFFNVKPHGKLDFVAEIFNVLNHPNITALNQVYGPALIPAASYLQPIQTLRPRQFQFSIDFEF
jgi:outer membrane receptor for ferrienterochelin and colicin